MKPKLPRAFLAAGWLLALAALGGCNKPGEGLSPMQAASANHAASAPSVASAGASGASAPSGVSSGASAASGAGTVGGSGTVSPPLPASAPVMPSDAQRQAGAQIAAQGAGGGAACASCHGAHGEGNGASGFPRIAGQAYAYLLHQLDSYADGARQNAVMAPMAKGLSAAQRQDVAAYYASLGPAGQAQGAAGASGTTAASASAAARASARPDRAKAGGAGHDARNDPGRQLAIAGDESRFVQACVNCHGPGGSGEGSAYPYLGGQYQNYLVNALKEWRDGTRNTDPSGQMPVIAKSLGDDQVTAVAAYYAAQPLPARPRDATTSALTARVPGAPASAITSGPRRTAGGNGAQGNGTEQGAPTTGASQGPGGGGGGSGSGPNGSATGAAQTGTSPPAGSGASSAGH